MVFGRMGHTLDMLPIETGRPVHLDKVALYFPDLKIVCTHTAWPWVEEAIALASKHPNVYMGTSAYAPKYWPPELVRFIDSRGRDKSKTWFSTGCGSVRIVDPESRTTRPTTAADVYDFARLVDALDHIHMFHRLGIPTDIEDTDDVDINLCYACVRGTSKPVSTSWFNGENVRRLIEMLGIVAGGETDARRPGCAGTT